MNPENFNIYNGNGAAALAIGLAPAAAVDIDEDAQPFAPMPANLDAVLNQIVANGENHFPHVPAAAPAIPADFAQVFPLAGPAAFAVQIAVEPAAPVEAEEGEPDVVVVLPADADEEDILGDDLFDPAEDHGPLGDHQGHNDFGHGA